MRRLRESLYKLDPWLLSSTAGALTIAQIALIFTLKQPRLTALARAGQICWWVGVVFAVLPIFTLRRRGGVAEGQSYMKTTTLVDSGIYAIVRHPQGGTAWLLFNTAAVLMVQHWSGTILGLLSMALVYADALKADQYCIARFGEAYKDYMVRVPRVNFILGITRLASRGAKAR